MRYETGYGLQNRVLLHLQDEENMQKVTVKTIQEADGYPLGEDETTAMFETFLTGLSMAAEEQRKFLNTLKRGSRVNLLRAPEELEMMDDTEVPEEEPVEDPERERKRSAESIGERSCHWASPMQQPSITIASSTPTKPWRCPGGSQRLVIGRVSSFARRGEKLGEEQLSSAISPELIIVGQ